MERELVAWLRETLPTPLDDDAAVLDLPAAEPLVVTTDSLGDGSHFRLGEVEPRWIGRKCLAVNLSDLAGMAARPVGVVVSLMIPRACPDRLALAKGLYAGMIPLATQCRAPIVGGDTNVWDGPLTVCITAFGQPTDAGPLTRRAARPGDLILVTGELGGSITGSHLDFTPRVDEALQLATSYPLHAGMDISDGLSLDLSRLCEASGCGAVLDADAVPASAAAHQLAMASGGDPLEHALTDGEDFELLLTADPDTARQIERDQPVPCGVTIVGEITADHGLAIRDAQGQQRTLDPKGYWHN